MQIDSCLLVIRQSMSNSLYNPLTKELSSRNELLDSLISTHKDTKMLNWWDGEDPFQIILETIGTQQCKLIDVSIWAYDLKLLVDTSIGGSMLSVVERELEDWIKNENSSWLKEADIAKKTQDWNKQKIEYLQSDKNKRAAAATRSLWAWYGKNFPKRIFPKFITTKEWTLKHKKWLIENKIEDIIRELNFNIIASKRKLKGIRDFIEKQNNSFFSGINKDNALKRLKEGESIGDETARKIALFYFEVPFIIYDEYFFRFCKRHKFIADDSEKWNVKNRRTMENLIFNWLNQYDNETKCKRLKAIHATINDFGNLYCKKEEPRCKECPLSKCV